LKSESAKCADDDAAHCVVYALVADLPTRHAYLVNEGFYEGGNFLLIDDRIGRQTVLPGLPMFSPDSQELLTIDNCVAYGSDLDLQIWKRSGDRFVEEWSHRTFSDQISEELVRWSSRDRLSLKFSTTELTGKPPVHWLGALVRHGKAWRLEMKLPPTLKDLDLGPPP